jgi:hypothetical protein
MAIVNVRWDWTLATGPDPSNGQAVQYLIAINQGGPNMVAVGVPFGAVTKTLSALNLPNGAYTGTLAVVDSSNTPIAGIPVLSQPFTVGTPPPTIPIPQALTVSLV